MGHLPACVRALGRGRPSPSGFAWSRVGRPGVLVGGDVVTTGLTPSPTSRLRGDVG
jgi:hypothetical protein